MTKKLFSVLFLYTALVAYAFAGLPDCDVCPEMLVIEPASFEMGKMVNYGYGDMDGPIHTVTFKAPFAIATKEVTLGEFRRFVKETGHVSEGVCNVYTETKPWHISKTHNWNNPGFIQEENHPVLCVSWDDTQHYIAWLNDKTGASYRLPSESEWEYLAATGGVIKGADGMVSHNEANIGKVECCGGKAEGNDQWIFTAPVGSFSPDKYGLYDIRGNVWEWQADCYERTYEGVAGDGVARTDCENSKFRVLRGGSYGDAADFFNHRFRLRGPQQEGYFTAGFRLAHDFN